MILTVLNSESEFNVKARSLRRYLSMLVFLCSAFLKIYLVLTFSLAFILDSFSLLTTVKNIAITQKYTTT